MRAEDFGRARHQVIEVIEHRREPLGVRLSQVIGGVAMHDAMRQVHPRAAARGEAYRVHAAAQEQPARLGGLPQHEHAVGGETFGAVQQHLHLCGFQGGQAVQGVHHHRFEMVPVLGQQGEFEILVQDAGLDRFAH